ncbi:hypothetical protein GCM10009692_24140 [Leucobacter aridicollis]
MHPNAVAEAHVRDRIELVEMPPARRDEANRELTNLARWGRPAAHCFDPAAAVDPQLTRAAACVQHDVANVRVVDEGDESTKRATGIGAERCRAAWLVW